MGSVGPNTVRCPASGSWAGSYCAGPPRSRPRSLLERQCVRWQARHLLPVPYFSPSALADPVALCRASVPDLVGTFRDHVTDPPCDPPLLLTDEGALVHAEAWQVTPSHRNGYRVPSSLFGTLHRTLWSCWAESLRSGEGFGSARASAEAALLAQVALVPLAALPASFLEGPAALCPDGFESPAAWARAEFEASARSAAGVLLSAWESSAAEALGDDGSMVLVLWDPPGVTPSVPALLLRRVLELFPSASAPGRHVVLAPRPLSRWVNLHRSKDPDLKALRCFQLEPAGPSDDVRLLETTCRLWSPYGEAGDLLVDPLEALRAARLVLAS